jgi:hypothetical protein
MADKKKDLVVKPEQLNQDPLYDMILAVGNEKLTLPQATTQMRVYVASLSDDAQEEWKKNAVPRARRLMSIAEAFTQELTVMGAGQ